MGDDVPFLQSALPGRDHRPLRRRDLGKAHHQHPIGEKFDAHRLSHRDHLSYLSRPHHRHLRRQGRPCPQTAQQQPCRRQCPKAQKPLSLCPSIPLPFQLTTPIRFAFLRPRGHFDKKIEMTPWAPSLIWAERKVGTLEMNSGFGLEDFPTRQAPPCPHFMRGFCGFFSLFSSPVSLLDRTKVVFPWNPTSSVQKTGNFFFF